MGTRDLEIARAVKLRPVEQVAETLGLDPDDLEPYGTYKAKVRWKAIERSRVRPDGALVLVTAMTPTPAGEGKSTIAIGLADGLRKLGSRSIVALRQPALGPVFGAKGGATGGGRAQVAPMEEINLHFTGDIHAVGAAHNLLAAMVDNHLVQGDALALDSRKIFWKRVVDMNDRALRNVIVGLGGPAHGVPRESGFEITEASELMAILCLATDLRDFKARAERVVVGATAGARLRGGRGDGPRGEGPRARESREARPERTPLRPGARRGAQPVRDRRRRGGRGDPRGVPRDGCSRRGGACVGARRRGRHRSGPGGARCGPLRRPRRVPLPVSGRLDAREEDRDDRHRDLRRRRRTAHARGGDEARALAGGGLRPTRRVHGEDSELALGRCEEARQAAGLHRERPRREARGRGRIRHRLHW